MKLVCPDGEPQYRRLLEPEQLARLEADGHELEWFDEAPDSNEGWIERLSEAEGVLLLWRLPPGVLRSCPTVRVISFVGTGVESYVEMEEARAGGVTVCNVPHYGDNAVAEHALALALAVARRVPDGDRAVRAGSWEQTEGIELRGRRLGVVGAGPIGRRMIELGRALGMSVVCPVLGAAPSGRAADELAGVASIPSSTLHRLLLDAHREGGLPRRCLLVVDEAGMAETRVLAPVLELVDRAQGKAILVGDPHQLPAVGAGGLYPALCERLGAISLAENRRQRDLSERQALARLRAGDPEPYLAHAARKRPARRRRSNRREAAHARRLVAPTARSNGTHTHATPTRLARPNEPPAPSPTPPLSHSPSTRPDRPPTPAHGRLPGYRSTLSDSESMQQSVWPRPSGSSRSSAGAPDVHAALSSGRRSPSSGPPSNSRKCAPPPSSRPKPRNCPRTPARPTSSAGHERASRSMSGARVDSRSSGDVELPRRQNPPIRVVGPLECRPPRDRRTTIGSFCLPLGPSVPSEEATGLLSCVRDCPTKRQRELSGVGRVA